MLEEMKKSREGLDVGKTPPKSTAQRQMQNKKRIYLIGPTYKC